MKYYLCFILSFFGFTAYAQNPEYGYRIYFNNKNTTTFSLNQPEQFLSPKAIQRRTKFDLSVDSSDLPVCQNYIDSVLSTTNGRLHCQSKWMNTIVVLVTDSALINTLTQFTFVKKNKLVAVYANGIQKPGSGSGDLKPTGFDQNYYGAAWKQIALCQGEYLHQQHERGKNILIALIDAGFDGVTTASAFDSLRNEGRLADRWNFVHDTVSVINSGQHGTKVLSCIAADLPQTFVGTAPKASFALYTSEDLTSEQPIEEDNWVAAAERADSLGADIITTSLGYNTFDPPFPDNVYSQYTGDSTFIAKGANKAASKGILVIASAGNEGVSPWHYILTPGDADSALTVGAVDSTDVVMTQSSYGPNTSGQIKPDVVAMGVHDAVINQYGYLEYDDGTSFSTPVIAGLAACLMQSDSTATPYQIKQAIRASADRFSNPNNHAGYGLPDFATAYNNLTGIATPQNTNPKPDITLYPNPLSGSTVFFRLPPNNAENFTLTLTNESGRTIFQKEFQINATNIYQFQFPTGTPGIYWLTIHCKTAIFHNILLKI